MHTAQDTFNRLRRAPFEKMRGKIVKLNETVSSDYILRAQLAALKRYGWTVEEFHRALDHEFRTRYIR